jgi:hypothetical protein
MPTAAIDDATDFADWRRTVALYGQFARILDDPAGRNTPSDELVSDLAEWISRTFAYYAGNERRFMDHLYAVLVGVEGWEGRDLALFTRLYKDNRLARLNAYQDTSEHRRPSPFEAAIETTRRIIDINGLRGLLAEAPTSCILGGSLSYGRFFNTRGSIERPDSSDIDLLLVVPNFDVLPSIARALVKLPGVDQDSVQSFTARIEPLLNLLSEHDHCIFGHKFRMWETTPDPYLATYQISGFYKINIHTLTSKTLNYLILRDLPVLEPDAAAFPLRVHEFRDDPARPTAIQRGFSGQEISIPVACETIQGGFLAEVSLADIVEGRFYPGVHLNLILPQFEVRWESPEMLLRLPLLGLRWKLLERLTEERRLRPFEHQTMSSSHTRHAIFAPHVRRRVDRE